MEPILLIHGYGSEQGTRISRSGAVDIYGGLPEWIRSEFGEASAVEVDLGRYISLEDGVSIDDISRALDAALKDTFGNLARCTFHVVIHSTGALVVRNWVRRFAGQRQPIRNLVYLAGANFGSGWAHVGSNRLARWGRDVFTGSEAGVRVLESLELGSSGTIDLHLELLQSGKTMTERRIREFVIIGSQPSTRWFELPIRYAKEDGSDGVVRVAASNLNFLYSKFEVNAVGRALTASDIVQLRRLKKLPEDALFYDRAAESLPGVGEREPVPLAIPYNTAHSGSEYGIVAGSRSESFVRPLLKQALEAATLAQWRAAIPAFDAATDEARELSKSRSIGGVFGALGWKRQSQYDRHSQVIIRLFDEDGRPIDDYDIFFDSEPAEGFRTRIPDLIEHTHRNGATGNVLTFFLRVEKWEETEWKDKLAELKWLSLEIEGNEPQTEDIQYVPFQIRLDQGAIKKWIVPDSTTVIDIVMRRVPSAAAFKVFAY